MNLTSIKKIKIIIVFVLVDIIFSAIIFSRHFFRDTDYFSIADQFHFTRYFVSPFLEALKTSENNK